MLSTVSQGGALLGSRSRPSPVPSQRTVDLLRYGCTPREFSRCITAHSTATREPAQGKTPLAETSDLPKWAKGGEAWRVTDLVCNGLVCVCSLTAHLTSILTRWYQRGRAWTSWSRLAPLAPHTASEATSACGLQLMSTGTGAGGEGHGVCWLSCCAACPAAPHAQTSLMACNPQCSLHRSSAA